MGSVVLSFAATGKRVMARTAAETSLARRQRRERQRLTTFHDKE
jgi:hypothetical protein